jgi:prolyl-tRNA synthetase
MIMAHGDDKGLVLPPKVAPMQVVIIPIYRNDEGKDKVLPKVEEIRNELESKEIRVHVDDREGLSPGYKFNDWEMKGVPLRIEIGPKDIEKESMVVAKRYNLEKISLNFTEIGKISTTLDEIQDEMLKKAKEEAKSNTMDILDYSDFKSKIEKGGFFNSPWCGKLECEEKIKEETGAEIRVIPFESENVNEKCIYCNEQSISMPIFARGY